ncbi:MAG: branched-chain amino acid ABC transporter permease [Armatimonadota bacterium]|nr:branched-chain amino acid ABC transporter permease [Armatimonadota bacterium]
MAVGLLAPLVLSTPYLRHILIIGVLNIALALSFDLLAGHLGHVSLAHPAFFGVGAYAAAVLNARWSLPVGGTFVAALVSSALLALLVSAPFFRLSELSFAVGTLGLSLVTQAVANNWISVTGGPMCITGIAYPARGLLAIGGVPQLGAYYLAFGIGVLAVALYALLTTGRLGRTLAAVQGDEILAGAFGVNPLHYKVLVFTMSAASAGVVGAFYAHYTTVICPDDLSPLHTLNLLVMVFVGGLGSLRGVIVGAVLFTILTEAARFAEALSQLAYGVILLAVILFAPDGIEAIFRRRRPRVSDHWRPGL